MDMSPVKNLIPPIFKFQPFLVVIDKLEKNIVTKNFYL